MKVKKMKVMWRMRPKHLRCRKHVVALVRQQLAQVRNLHLLIAAAAVAAAAAAVAATAAAAVAAEAVAATAAQAVAAAVPAVLAVS